MVDIPNTAEAATAAQLVAFPHFPGPTIELQKDEAIQSFDFD